MNKKPPFISIKTLRESFNKTMVKHGAIDIGAYFRLPVGKPDPSSEREEWLRISLHAAGYGHDLCTIHIDRWSAKDAPLNAEEWFKLHLYPYAYAAIDYLNKDHFVVLPSGASFAQVTILRVDMLKVLDEWIPKEKEWQTLTEPIDLLAGAVTSEWLMRQDFKESTDQEKS